MRARTLFQYWPTAIVVAVIVYATWWAHPIDPDDIPAIPHIDKLIHAVMMGGLLGALLFDYKRADRGRVLSARVIARFSIAVVCFSVVDEVVQGLLPIGRPSDWLDLLADWVGVGVAYITAPPTINRIFRTKKSV